MKPIPAKPRSSIAQVDGSGTAEAMVKSAMIQASPFGTLKEIVSKGVVDTKPRNSDDPTVAVVGIEVVKPLLNVKVAVVVLKRVLKSNPNAVFGVGNVINNSLAAGPS